MTVTDFHGSVVHPAREDSLLRRVLGAELPRGLRLRRAGRWLVLSAPCESDAGDDLGILGPWRARGAGRQWAELPPVWRDAPDPHAAQAALLRWAVDCLRTDFMGRAAPPQVVKRFRAQPGLSLDADGHAVSVGLMADAGRLALRANLAWLPPGLCSARRDWARRLLAHACRQQRLVRLGLLPDGGVGAEVDLSGAPHELLDALLASALSALRLVAAPLLPALALLRDGHASALLDQPPTGTVPVAATPLDPYGDAS